jgi:hypothetical protein
MEKALWLEERRKGIGANQFNSLPMPERFWAYTEKKGDCIIWTGAVNGNGYGCLRLNGKAITASRKAFELYNGKIPDGLFILHRCDNPLCVNPEHLFAGTHQDNMRDRDIKGRVGGIAISSVGEGNVKAKLTEQDVLAIRSSTEGSRALGKKYGVHRVTIQGIRRKKIWRHI